MAIELLCSCGQLLRFDEPPAGGQARCPNCNALLTIENDRSMLATITDPVPTEVPPTATRKPLWAVMARDQDRLTIPRQPGDSAAPASSSIEPVPSAGETSGPRSGRKGLWSVMHSPAAVGAVPTVDPHPGAGTDSKRIGPPGSPEASPQSYTHPGANTPGSPELSSKSEIPNPKSQISVPVNPASTPGSPSDSLAAMIGIEADEALLSVQSKAAGLHADNSRRAVAAAVLGGLSIPLSGLALVNAGWSRLPAPAVGFLGILTGLIASQEIQRSGGRKTGRRLAIAGIVSGIVGSFLGPVVIAPLGRPRKGR
jgi:hypothetical protein